MTNTNNNDIHALLKAIDPNEGNRPRWDNWETVIFAAECTRYHHALTALVAERDGYLEGNKQTLRALEEANEIAKRYKRERDEARRRVCELSLIKNLVYRKLDGVDGRFIQCKTPEEIAQVYDWDCFKEAGGA